MHMVSAQRGGSWVLYFCFAAWAIVVPFAVSAQHDSKLLLNYSLLTNTDGLAASDVRCTMQDSKGFMWFGTRNGLNRYDGSNFLLFTRQHHHMRSNKVAFMVEDGCGRLWLLYAQRGNGLVSDWKMDIMDMASHRVQPFAAEIKNAPFAEETIYWIGAGDSNKVIIITAPNTIWEYSCTGGFKKRCEIPWPVESISVQTCRFTKNVGIVYNGNETTYLNGNTPRLLPGIKELPFVFDETQRPLFLSKKSSGDYKITTENDKIVNSEITIAKVGDGDMYYDGVSNTALWRNNSSVFLYRKGNVIDLKVKEHLPQFTDYMIQNFTIDALGNVWLCSNKGVLKIKVAHNHFQHYFKKDKDADESYLANQVRGIYADSAENIYANVWQQFCRANSPNVYKILSSVSGSHILYPLVHFKNKFWFGARGLGYFVDKFKPVIKTPDEQLTADVWALYQLDSNQLIFGADHRFPIIYDVSRDSFLQPAPQINAEVPSLIYRFSLLRNGTIGVASEVGFYILNKQGAVTTYYGNRNADTTHPLPSDDLFDFHEANDSVIWLATNGEGLIYWNRQGNSFKQFTVAEGLPSNIIYRIEEDSRNNLWLSTDNGLVRFDTRNFSINTYNVDDGVLQKEFNRISSCKSPNGKMYFGGLDGVTGFNPEDFYSDRLNAAPLRVTSYTVFSAEQDKVLDETAQLLSKNEIVLEPGSRFFNLAFMLLDFEKSGHNYIYQIEGLDKAWTHTTDNFVRISGLPYGNYVLRIKGQSASGRWSQNEIKIPLTVIAPLLQRRWFQALLGILLLGAVFAFIRYRTYRLSRDKQALEKTVEQRTEQLRDLLSEKDLLMKEIHHRVKNNLQVISALLEMQGNRSGDEGIKSAITESQNRVLSISFIHQNLYQNEDLKGVEFRSFSLELAKHIEKVFAKPGVAITINNNIPQTLLDIDTAVPLGLIINELMTNSFKYAFNDRNNGRIKMQLQKTATGEYLFSYYDDGPGVENAADVQKMRSLGLRLVNQLIRQLAGKLTYSNINGSRFVFSFKDFEARSNMV